MKIVVNDCSGHPFQVHLSRELARRGHEVIHLYASFATPKGSLSRRASDPPTLDIASIDIGEPFQKYNLWKRWSQVNQYGRLVAKEIERISPGVVLASNNPLEAQQRALRAATRVGARFVYWLQDVYSGATSALLPKKLGAAGHLIARHYVGLEGRLLSRSDEIVMISPDFRQELQRWKLPEGKMHVIPNWAPIEEVPQRPKDNRWSRALGLQDKFVFLYAGTLGLKHNPRLLLSLASALQERPNGFMVVVSEGPMAELVKAEAQEARLGKVIVLGFQSYEDLPDMLGAADVLVAILDKDAGVFSVPSKVLMSLCAGKALLLSVPMENLASRLVVFANAGRVAAPDNEKEFIRYAMALMDDPQMRHQLGANARAYAETTFDISRIADSFEAILTGRHVALPQMGVLG